MEPAVVLKPSALFNFLQDMASWHAEALGFGYSHIYPDAWVLLKYRAEFDEYPSGLFSLEITTEPRGYQKLFAYRDFEIYSGQKRLGRVSSLWAIVNDKGFVSPQTLNNPIMGPLQKRENDLEFAKIPPLKKADAVKNFKIRYEDIDINGHVNNINYIIWAFEALSFDFRSSHRLKTIDVIFKKEVKYGSEIISQAEFKDENTTIHAIKNAETNEDLCYIQAVWD
jgi:medium-chain acyl-[acyl-carrier-protein] hydrolase